MVYGDRNIELEAEMEKLYLANQKRYKRVLGKLRHGTNEVRNIMLTKRLIKRNMKDQLAEESLTRQMHRGRARRGAR
jgi:hypothetical protein